MSFEIKECIGYTREDAFKNLKFNPMLAKGSNCTQAWNNAGNPIPGTNEFKKFIVQQLNDKTGNIPGLGIHISIDPPINDTRSHPYTTVNYKTEGVRKWEFTYLIREDELEISKPYKEIDEDGDEIVDAKNIDINIVSYGKVVSQKGSKAKAFEEAKKLTTATHKSYTIIPVKIPNRSKIAGHCIYTPSASSKKGKWIVAGYTTNDNEY